MTYALPYCEVCPPQTAWPTKNLILGTCPECGRFGEGAWRLAIARRRVAALEGQQQA